MDCAPSPHRALIHRLALGLALVASLAALSLVTASAAAPPSAIDAARADLAERSGAAVDDVLLLRDAAVTWSDGCLGAAEPGEFCTEALVDGFVLWLGLADAAYRYHTDAAQTVRFAAGPLSLHQVGGAPLPAGATPRAPGFVGDFPPEGGVALLTWQGGDAADLVQAVPGATSFWVTAEGRFVGYIPGAPAFVNAAFLALYPDGSHIADGTHMLVVMPRVAVVDFDRTGNVVFGTPGLPVGLWHLVYEEFGAPALTVSLTFTADSQCLLPTGAAFLCDELEVGTRARVTGHLLAENAVRVVRLQVLE